MVMRLRGKELELTFKIFIKKNSLKDPDLTTFISIVLGDGECTFRNRIY